MMLLKRPNTDKDRILILVNLVKKADYSTNINETENKFTDHHHSNNHINTQEFSRLTADDFADRLTQANLASKNDFADFVKKADFDEKQNNCNKKIQITQNMY